MTDLDSRQTARATLRLGILGALLTATGAILSGPVALFVLAHTHPQPPFRDAELLAQHFHPIQSLPYALGLALVLGLVLLMASLCLLAPAALRVRSVVAGTLTAVFATLIALNYIVQTTFVPGLLTPFDPRNAAIVEAFTMVNPRSLGWALEMWGYGVLGAATWLLAPVFAGSKLERATAAAFIANGVMSIVGAFWTAVQPGWVLTPIGIGMFGAWNVVIVGMALLALLCLRARR